MKERWQKYLTKDDWCLLYRMIELVKERGQTRLREARRKRRARR